MSGTRGRSHSMATACGRTRRHRGCRPPRGRPWAQTCCPIDRPLPARGTRGPIFCRQREEAQQSPHTPTHDKTHGHQANRWAEAFLEGCASHNEQRFFPSPIVVLSVAGFERERVVVTNFVNIAQKKKPKNRRHNKVSTGRKWHAGVKRPPPTQAPRLSLLSPDEILIPSV